MEGSQRKGVRGDECLTGGPLSNFSSYLIIAEWRGWEEENRRKERSRMKAVTAQAYVRVPVRVCVCVLVGVRCGSVCMSSQHFNSVCVDFGREPNSI